MFWGKLKYYIVHALNRCFEKGQLSVSLHQSIIICLPKGNKDRSLIKNWRTISLLSVLYKLASGVIEDRLKESLNKIISNCQSGFIKGRYISDSTRLIYDALEIAETLKISGLLMCIDFEKAFDSLSWKFLYKVLSYLQSALNTLEIFGNLNGLKMNKEKTKVIWIGSEKHCKEKFNVTVNLEWGNTEFTALGLKFSTNLHDIPSLNYNNAL